MNLATGEYLDMYKYSCHIYNTEELFDESIEYYYTDTWLNSTIPGGDTDDMIMDAFSSLRSLSNSLYILVNRAEEKCCELWSIVLLSAPDSVRQHYFGKDIIVSEEIVEEAIKSSIENMCENIYDYNVERATKKFAAHLNQHI